MPASRLKTWVLLCLINLLLVAAVGVLMRYKIGYSLPWLDQKNLQHAHSHFAFAGWVSQLIMICLIEVIADHAGKAAIRRYSLLLWANYGTAIGMLISFACQGYGIFSITFSSASILIAFTFSYYYYQDIKKRKDDPSRPWFFAALLFNMLSAFGTAFLVYMMATKTIEQHRYLASVYWYLHFQYNGWFLFAGLGLGVHYLKKAYPLVHVPPLIFKAFFGSCFFTYGLSVLWLQLPLWLYIFVAIAALAQFTAWIYALYFLRQSGIAKKGTYSVIAGRLLLFAMIAFTIKISLQLFSIIPSISKLAFGFRPVVIAYLHLALLACTSIFLLGYCFLTGLIHANKQSGIAIFLFAAGVFLNELVLAAQGILSFDYTPLPYANDLLLLVSILILISLFHLVVTQLKVGNNTLPYDSGHK